MAFKAGQVANPNGRPRKPTDPRSESMVEFCKRNKDKIEKVGNILLEKALKEQEPWAIKLAMEMFYPKPGTFAPPEKPIKQTNVQINTLLKEMPADEQHELWQLLVKAEKRRPNVIDVKPTP